MSDTPSDLPSDPVDPNLPPQDPVDTIDPPADPEPPKKDRYKEDLLKQKAANKALQDKIDAQNKLIEDQRVAKLKEQENFKELYEEEQRKREEAEQKSSMLSNAVIEDKKQSAVKTIAMQMGIRKEALNDLDLLSMDTLGVETTSTGKVNILGAKDFVETLKITKPHWFGRRSVNLNGGEPEVIPTDGLITLDMVKKAEREYKKTGDSSKYTTLLKNYKQQSM